VKTVKVMLVSSFKSEVMEWIVNVVENDALICTQWLGRD